jgi:EmrB/QacA subfamily drug resistance transporter
MIKAAQPCPRNEEISIMSPSPATGGRRRLGWTLFLLAFAQLVIAVDYNIVFVALPDIGAQLGFSRQTLQWVVSAYGVAFGGFLLLGGRAADLLGRRRIFIFALALYGVSSLVGGLATSPSAIIIARAIQGVGGALLFPATLSLVTTLFAEGRERNRALAVWGGAGASGLTVGALLGGILTSAYGWPAVFFVNVPLVAIIIAGALIVMPRDVSQGSHRSFDLPGALTATIGITLLVYVLVQGPESGWASPSILLALVAGLVLLAAFFVIEARSDDPLMPLRLFSNRYALAGMLLTLFFGATLGALPYFETVLFQGMLGFDALWTGLAFLVPAIAIFVGTQLGERMATGSGVRTSLVIGQLLSVAGMVAFAYGISPEWGYAGLVPGMAVLGVGQGMVWTAMWIVSATGVAQEEQGVASGMASTSLQVGLAVGLAILVAVANGVGESIGQTATAGLIEGTRFAVYLAAVGTVLGLIVALTLPRRAEIPAGVQYAPAE